MAETSEPVRAFVAVKLPPELLADVQKLQQRLESRLKTTAVRWTKAEQLHLTLWFLGNVPAERLQDLEAALQQACAGTPPLTLRLEGLGCFPTFKRPNVVWLGVTGDVDALKALAQRVSQETKKFGEHDEKRAFKAHLTIARLRDAPFRELERVGGVIEGTQIEPLGQWTATQVELIRSQLSPKGATYTPLAAAKLCS